MYQPVPSSHQAAPVAPQQLVLGHWPPSAENQSAAPGRLQL